MDECQDGMFEAWYEKIAQEEPEKQRKVSPLSGVIGSDWECGEERLQGDASGLCPGEVRWQCAAWKAAVSDSALETGVGSGGPSVGSWR